MKLGNDIRVIMTKPIVTILVEIVWPSNQMSNSMDFGSKHNKETNERKKHSLPITDIGREWPLTSEKNIIDEKGTEEESTPISSIRLIIDLN